jgi:hypothetical protein
LGSGGDICGPMNGNTGCIGSSFGPCCSSLGYCGASSDYCGTFCNPLFGSCFATCPGSPSASSAPPAPTASSTCNPTLLVNQPGVEALPLGSGGEICGPMNGNTGCIGSSFGPCCSSLGFCGTLSGYCGPSCDPLYGSCYQTCSISATP